MFHFNILLQNTDFKLKEEIERYVWEYHKQYFSIIPLKVRTKLPYFFNIELQNKLHMYNIIKFIYYNNYNIFEGYLMIKPLFKFIATILIGIFLSSVLFLSYNILNQQTYFVFQGDLFLIMYKCLFGLIFLTMVYYLWAREIEIFYKNKNIVKK